MKSFFATSIVLIVLLICCFACNDMDDADRKYLFLPEKITRQSRDSTERVVVTSYIFDEKNRPVEIYDIGVGLDSLKVQIRDTVHTFIEYDVQGRPLSMEVETRWTRGGIPQEGFINVYDFMYQDMKVNFLYGSLNSTDKGSYSIETNSKDQALRIYSNTGNDFIINEYDKRGNISKTITAEDSVYVYNYDDRRGVFREMNIPQWFIDAILLQPRGINTLYLGEKMNIKNNCLNSYSISTGGDSPGDLRPNASFEYEYGGFGYPLTIRTGEGYQATIRYIPAS